MTTFFWAVLLIAVKLNFSKAPRAQDNLSKVLGLPHRVHRALVKLLTALSTIAAPSAGTHTKNVHKF